jgi:ribosomal protein L16 Arg81 hydroxylase
MSTSEASIHSLESSTRHIAPARGEASGRPAVARSVSRRSLTRGPKRLDHQAMATSYSLAQLLHPITPEVFLEEYFERRPLLVKRKDPDYYKDVLTRQDVDRVITTLHPHFPDVQIINAKQDVDTTDYCYPNNLIDVARLYQQFFAGGTILVGHLQEHLGRMADVCRSLEGEMSARFQANIYLTPAESKGFRRHWDGHDVFVLQVEGYKHWRVYDEQAVLPLKGESFDPATARTDAEATMDFHLEAGDLFYLPRGLMHDAVTNEEHSLHITVGTFGTSWAEVLMEAIGQAATTDRDFRMSLPAGFARSDFDRTEVRATFQKLLQRAVERVDIDAALDHFADDLVSTRNAHLTGQLDQMLRLGDLSLDTEVGVRPNLIFRLRKDDEHVVVSCYGGTTSLPVHAAEPLAHALETQRFRVSDLPGDLDDDGKLVLISLLIREGLLQML